jgi:hypothetical protein
MTAVFAGVFGAASLSAQDKKETPKEAAPVAAPAAPAPVAGVVTGDCGTAAPAVGGCGVTYQTVRETVMVPTYVQEPRTVYKQQMQAQTYTAYRTEVVPTQQTRTVTVNRLVTETVMESRTVTVNKPVTETVMETRTVTERVPVTKTITVNETHYTTEMVTEMRTKTVRNVVKVPTEVNLGPGLAGRLQSFMNPCYCPCPRTVTICKRQVTCDTVCEPVTVCKKVAHCVPVTKQVCSYECVTKTVQVPVTRTRCVPETQTVQVPVCRTRCVPETKTITCTVNVCQTVPYTATRNVCVTVPVTENVTVCKLVPQVVERQVAVSTGNGGCGVPACGAADPCGSNACSTGGKLFNGQIRGRLAGLGSSLQCRVSGLFAGLRSLGNRGCAAPACDLGCGAPAAPACGGCN